MLNKLNNLFKRKNEVDTITELKPVSPSKTFLENDYISMEIKKVLVDKGLNKSNAIAVAVVDVNYKITKTEYSFNAMLPKLEGGDVVVEAEDMEEVLGDLTIKLNLFNRFTSEELEGVSLKFKNVKIDDFTGYSRRLRVDFTELVEVT